EPDGTQARHPGGEPGALDHVDHALDVLVGLRGLLGESPRRGGADGYAALLEAPAQLRALDLPANRGPRKTATGSVAGGAERAIHRVGTAREYERGGAHAAGD